MERTFIFHFDDDKDSAPRIWDGIVDVFKKESFSCTTNHLLLSYALKDEKFPIEDVEMVETSDKTFLHETHKQIFEKDDPESATMDYMEEALHTDGMKAFIFQKSEDEAKITLGMCLLLVEKHAACLCGFGMIPTWQGKGYASKALKQVSNYLSDIPGMERVNVEVNGLNEKGLGLYTSFGFEKKEIYSVFESENQL